MAQRYRSIDPAQADTQRQAPAGSTVYYQFRDAEGNTHIVDSLTLLPRSAKHVQRITLQNEPLPSTQSDSSHPPADLADRALQLLGGGGSAAPSSTALPAAEPTAGLSVPAPEELLRDVPKISTPTMLMGAAAIFGVGLMLRPIRATVLRLGITVLGLTLMGSFYMQWLSKHMPPPGGPDSAINATRALQQQAREQAEALDSLEGGK